MSPEALGDGAPRRIAPPSGEPSTHLTIWQTLIAHLGERCWVGQIKLTNRALRREARIWTLEDGEHLILLVLEAQLCHWEGTRGSVSRVRRQACDWLCELPARP